MDGVLDVLGADADNDGVVESLEGTVSFLFTDIEGSTRLLLSLGAQMYADVLAVHRRLLRSTFEECGGRVVDTQGDAFFVAFGTARAAVTAAIAAQRSLAGHPWPGGRRVDVRMGVHTGEPTYGGEGYVGIDVHRAARICSAAHGGQVLVSETSRGLLGKDLGEVRLRDLGEHRLKDLHVPERLYQLVVPGLAGDFPPLRTLGGYRHNLPAQPTPLIGRDEQVTQACTLLRGPVRLLTLTGPGGSGKTRLGLQIAAEMTSEVPGGVFLVELAPLADSSLVVPAVANALDVREAGHEPLLDVLKQHLREEKPLLLMDNFEHLQAGMALVGEFLNAAAGLRVLVTSRVPLRLPSEHEFEVPPLPLPGTADVDAVAQSAATALFLQHARAVNPRFPINDSTAPAVAEICARLDGLPLAIELAAARTKLLPPRALLARLGRRLPLLTTGARDAPTRQRTLRGAIDWSYELLARSEQALFARLAVFAGGCRLEAAEAVCAGEEELVGDLLDGLTSLLDNSLLRRSEDSDGEPRFTMLETIREYAAERLEESGEATTVSRRHAQYCRELAESAERALWGPEQQAWFDRLDRDHDNLRTALRFSLSSGTAETGLAIAAAIAPFWEARGHITEGRMWLRSAVDAAGEADPGLRGQALFYASRLANLHGDRGEERSLLEHSVRLYRKAGDTRGEVFALSHLANSAELRGEHDVAREVGLESVARARQLDDAWYLAMALNNLGYNLTRQGDLGEHTVAILTESLRLRRALEEKRGVAVTLSSLAELRLLQGELADAEVLLGEMTTLAGELQHSELTLIARCLWGYVRLARSEDRAADTAFHEVLQRAKEIGHRELVAQALVGLAEMAGRDGQPVRAARLASAGRSLLESVDEQPGQLEREALARIAARDRSLDEATRTQAFAAADGVNPEDVVAEELQRLRPARLPSAAGPRDHFG